MAYTTINKHTDYFNTVRYTGDGSSSRSITGVGFQPDWLWVKERSSTSSHQVVDAVRGAYRRLQTDNANAESVDSSPYNDFKSFDSDGWSMGNGGAINENSQTYVAWNWLGANGTASNTDGSITSTVSANTTAGFSIVSYTGTGSNATVGHGLGAVPKVVITKNRSSANNWAMYHASPGNTRSLPLDLNTYPPTNSAYWNNTTPTSSVFTVSTGNDVNKSGDNMIAYCFAEKPGYSKFGSYTGNGNASGPFIYTGFAPAFVLIRRYDFNDNFNWILMDNKRPGFNVISEQIKPNLSDAADSSSSYTFADFYSNGFKPRNTAIDKNADGGSYAYLAFGQTLVGSNNIPVTAR